MLPPDPPSSCTPPPRRSSAPRPRLPAVLTRGRARVAPPAAAAGSAGRPGCRRRAAGSGRPPRRAGAAAAAAAGGAAGRAPWPAAARLLSPLLASSPRLWSPPPPPPPAPAPGRARRPPPPREPRPHRGPRGSPEVLSGGPQRDVSGEVGCRACRWQGETFPWLSRALQAAPSPAVPSRGGWEQKGWDALPFLEVSLGRWRRCKARTQLGIRLLAREGLRRWRCGPWKLPFVWLLSVLRVCVWGKTHPSSPNGVNACCADTAASLVDGNGWDTNVPVKCSLTVLRTVAVLLMKDYNLPAG